MSIGFIGLYGVHMGLGFRDAARLMVLVLDWGPELEVCRILQFTGRSVDRLSARTIVSPIAAQLESKTTSEVCFSSAGYI